MPREKSDASFLWDMLSAARSVCSFVEGHTLEEYENDILLRSAVERQLEIIGEAGSRISKSFRDRHPKISWSRIKSQRNVLAHEYGEIKHETNMGRSDGERAATHQAAGTACLAAVTPVLQYPPGIDPNAASRGGQIISPLTAQMKTDPGAPGSVIV